MGAYLDALGRFKNMAQGLYGGPADTPDISGGYAAAMLRYLKDRAAQLTSSPCEPWELIGREVAHVVFDARVPVPLRDRLWSYALCVCQAADEQGLAFVQVKPDPKQDHELLRRKFGAADTPVDTPEADELEIEGKKPDKTTGDQINLGLFLIAAIVIASVFHRR